MTCQPYSAGETDFTELFAKGKEDIKEAKLRVSYVQPAPPPSPVPEGEEEKVDEAAERPSLQRMYTTKPEFDSAKAEAKLNLRGGNGDASDTATLQRELERYRLKNDSLTTDLNMALKNNKGGVSGAARGFSLLHLIITGAWGARHPPTPSFFYPTCKGLTLLLLATPPPDHPRVLYVPSIFFSLSLAVFLFFLLEAFATPFEPRTHLSIPPRPLFSIFSCSYFGVPRCSRVHQVHQVNT